MWAKAVADESRPLVNCFVVAPGRWTPAQRELVAEEPLTILIGDQAVATLMRTPGDEVELATGFRPHRRDHRLAEGHRRDFLLREGRVERPERSARVRSRKARGRGGCRRIAGFFRPAASAARDDRGNRRGHPGLCAAAAPAGRRGPFRARGRHAARAENVQRTGGTHAAALARPPVKPGAECIVREDLGRHNALDKAVGAAAQNGMLEPGWPAAVRPPLVRDGRQGRARGHQRGRRRQRAVGVGGGGLARRLNMFLAGFVRERTLTIYSGADALRREA